MPSAIHRRHSPLLANGLVCGVDKRGRLCGAHISVEELSKRITFTRRKFRGFDVKPLIEGMQIDVTAPIIDDK
jgi:hypothetical protein